MKTKVIKILIPVIIVLLIAGGFFYKYLKRTRFNDGYVNGNSAGNLYNAGLFCESNGVVFFSNPDDNGKLYSMSPDGTNIKKLCDNTVMYINADDHYVYYVRNNTGKNTNDYSFFSYNNNSLCRIDRAGGKEIILDQDPCIYATLIGNYIYYLHYDSKTATTLYKIKIDGSERKKLKDYYVFTCSAYGQYFYYNGNEHTGDGNLYQYDTNTDTDTMLYSCDAYKPIVTGDNNVYYMDVSHNMALVHTNTNFDNPIIISAESIDCFNVYGSYIYYQVVDGDQSRLCRIKNDGTEEMTIAMGTYCNINVTSHYVYFTDFNNKKTFYAPTNNPGTVTLFAPGKE